MIDEQAFNENINIVYHCYNKLSKNYITVEYKDEIIQEGLIALWNAVKTYDKGRSEKVSSYIFPCVKNAMLNFIRNMSRSMAHTLSLYTPINEDPNQHKEMSLIDVVSYETDSGITIEEILNIYDKWLHKHHKNQDVILRRLNRAEIILLELSNDPKTKAITIQNKCNINRTTISSILSEIRTSLKDEYPTRFNNKRRHKNENKQ